MFTITAAHLRRLLEINSFPAPERDQELVFFGLRGCLPAGREPLSIAREQPLELTTVNYVNPRCTLVQWRPWATDDAALAVFPGSTVPNANYVRDASRRGGAGANQMETGYYPDYRKGLHHANDSERAQQAFVQTAPRPVRRTSDDLDFDTSDPATVELPSDNLHAAWCENTDQETSNYSSAGCQVVVGYPDCPAHPGESGPWKVFRGNAYALEQQTFPYVLLNAQDAAALDLSRRATPRLRFGSKGPLVTQLQRALDAVNFYAGRIDDRFGERTYQAVIAFQTAKLGACADDGVVGPRTASALGIPWPQV